MAEKDFRKILPMNKGKWKCPTCKVHQNIKVTSSPSGSEIFPVDFERYMSHIDAKIDNFAIMFTEKIKNDIKDIITSAIATEISAINNKIASISELEKSLEYHIAEHDRLKSITDDQGRIMKEMKTAHDQLQRDFNSMKLQLGDMEQINRQCNVEIHNVPETKNENVLNIAANLASALSVPIPPEQIRSAHRVASGVPGRPRNIVLQLATRRLRDDVVAAARVRRGLSSQSLQLPAPAQQIYVNEHLTLANKMLYAKVRDAKKQKGYDYVWIRSGKIYARKHSGDKFLVIRCEGDIAKM